MLMPLLLAPQSATTTAQGGWGAADWTLGVVVPLVLLAAGVFLYLRGRAAHQDATRIKGGFGGPPGSLDIGTELGFGVEENRKEVLAAQRLKLWGLVLVGVAVVWLLVTLIVAIA